MQPAETEVSALGLKPSSLLKEKPPKPASPRCANQVPRAVTGAGIPPAPAHVLGPGFYLAGVEAIDWFDQLPGLTSHLAPLLSRCKQRKQTGYHR